MSARLLAPVALAALLIPLESSPSDGVVGIAWNPPLFAQLPEAVREAAQQLEGQISSGEFEVPRAGF